MSIKPKNMKTGIVNDRIQVLESNSDVWKIIRDITGSGLQEEAFYICDLGEIVRKYKEWKLKMPRVEPHYAVKCNDIQIVCEVLATLGASFDCASKGEITKILDLGVDPSRIIFANPCKPLSHIRYASAVNVDLMTFDNETELHKIKSLYPTAKLVLRIRCDADAAQCQLGMKFGCDPINEGPRLLDIAHVLGLDVVGVSFHVGSGCTDAPAYRRAISACRVLFDYGETLGYHFNLLDIGGGFPGNKGTSIDKIAEVVNTALDDFFPDPEVHVIAEPGRFMVAASFTLVANIHSKRVVCNESGVHNMYYINDGVYGSFNSILYDHAVVTPVPLKTGHSKFTRASIWGPTCDGLDQVCENVVLPELEVGDWIVFENMGAYTLPVASPFNGFPIPRVHVVTNEAVWMLLKDTLTFCDNDFVISTDRVALDTTIPLTSVIESRLNLGQPVFKLLMDSSLH